MGQFASAFDQDSGNYDELDKITNIDGGQVVPQGLYSQESIDYDVRIVKRLIIHKKLAPFYQGFGDEDELRQFYRNQQQQIETNRINLANEQQTKSKKSPMLGLFGRLPSSHRLQSSASDQISANIQSGSNQNLGNSRRNTMNISTADSNVLEHLQINSQFMQALENPVECPICFLYYPANINYTRCCNQPICTECFLQIKRSEDGRSATCPYCVEFEFGVTYNFKNSMEQGRKTSKTMSRADAKAAQMMRSQSDVLEARLTSPLTTQRHNDTGTLTKSQSAAFVDKDYIVLSDDVRPEVVAKIKERQRLAARAAEESERAMRRMRHQHRHRRRRQPHDSEIVLTSPNYTFFPGMLDISSEIEDLMLNEAIRQSMLEEEERQRHIEREASEARLAQSSSQQQQQQQQQLSQQHQEDSSEQQQSSAQEQKAGQQQDQNASLSDEDDYMPLFKIVESPQQLSEQSTPSTQISPTADEPSQHS
ncbi:hypothetical protein MP228_007031 [Amoeboaphelidium protococcarum]|nr:hypothetical protein MP228_007031 [Amoeboaphelidium protococcarum]